MKEIPWKIKIIWILSVYVIIAQLILFPNYLLINPNNLLEFILVSLTGFNMFMMSFLIILNLYYVFKGNNSVEKDISLLFFLLFPILVILPGVMYVN